MARVGKACTMCKLRKSKCDGSRPCCSRCLKSGLLQCEYLPDKRIDKRQRKGGKHVFIFKNGMGEMEAPERNIQSPDVTHNHIPPAVSEKAFFLASNMNESDTHKPAANKPRSHKLGIHEGDHQFPVSVDVPNNLPWSDFIPDSFLADIDFKMDEFFCSLDEALPVESHFEFAEKGMKLHHKCLIEAVFDNKMHIPPAVSYEMILDIDSLIHRADDEEFLHATVLTIGALTLAKRDLAGQRRRSVVSFSSEAETAALDLRIPAMAAEAFGHYSRAKKLISSILAYPSSHGFRGLALMANFMSVLFTPKTQMYITYYALQIAVAIGLTRIETIEPGSQDHELVLAFWGIWCSSSMLSTFHGRPPPLSKDDIVTSANVTTRNSYVDKFFRIRIMFAELAGLVIKAVATEDNKCSHTSHEKLSLLCNEMNKFEEIFAKDATVYNRHELLTLGLRCWKAHVSMLLNMPALMDMRSNRAVVEAKTIIKDLWAYYHSYKQNCLPHLDWDFCFPLRNATLCVWEACMVLTKSTALLSYLSFDCLELKLGHELLRNLTSIIPINKYLIRELEALRSDGLAGFTRN